jgi:hypothetical protein
VRVEGADEGQRGPVVRAGVEGQGDASILEGDDEARDRLGAWVRQVTVVGGAAVLIHAGQRAVRPPRFLGVELADALEEDLSEEPGVHGAHDEDLGSGDLNEGVETVGEQCGAGVRARVCLVELSVSGLVDVDEGGERDHTDVRGQAELRQGRQVALTDGEEVLES